MSGTQDTDAPDNEPEEGRFHRRGFFKEGFRQLFRPLADMVEERLERVGVPLGDDDEEYRYGGADVSDHFATEASAGEPVLRPPGALPEGDFLDSCLSSGQCVNVCPVAAIKFASSEDPRRDGKPFIDPQVQACVVCDDLSCMHACPSGALVPVSKEEIAMGVAEVRQETCVRSQGEDCQICTDKCPLGSVAIDISYGDGPVEVRDPGCVGCGVCEMYCPTDPKAIVVVPRSNASYGGDDEAPSGEGSISSSGPFLPMS